MNGNSEPLQRHANYERLVELACDSHERGRAPDRIAERDVTLARLYCHAFRGHVIGAFHATRLALSECPSSVPLAAAHLLRAREHLTDLANRAMDLVGDDMRALISTFHHYATHVSRALDALDLAVSWDPRPELQLIRNRFLDQMQRITAGNGIYLTQDTHAPEQASFVVPNLGITIVPLVYGDYHSWNLAWLNGARSDVPYHQHYDGVEIHLGYGPLRGFTVLGNYRAAVDEGYAMPIPPRTRHGYTNDSELPHHVPFVFGSLTRGGWGVFLDVEPQPMPLEKLELVPVPNQKMNGTIYLEREIAAAGRRVASVRYPILPARATDRGGTGGLELSVARVTPRGLQFRCPRFCAVSVVAGRGVVEIAGEEKEIARHDHFGIPSGVDALVRQLGDTPLVTLDTVLK
jgi:hypothetical protein